ncbi:MAG: hypothetical protein RLZZ430_1761, partial [Cyanobacteriota bacterium]
GEMGVGLEQQLRGLEWPAGNAGILSLPI